MPPKSPEKDKPEKAAEKPVEKAAEKAAEPKAPPHHQRELEAAISDIKKNFGEGAIIRMGDAQSRVKISVIPTGSLAVDLALGVGGIPRGRVIEIFGPESSGKTTLMLHVLTLSTLWTPRMPRSWA